MSFPVMPAVLTTPTLAPPEDPKFFVVKPEGRRRKLKPNKQETTDDDFQPRWWPGTEPLAEENAVS